MTIPMTSTLIMIIPMRSTLITLMRRVIMRLMIMQIMIMQITITQITITPTGLRKRLSTDLTDHKVFGGSVVFGKLRK